MAWTFIATVCDTDRIRVWFDYNLLYALSRRRCSDKEYADRIRSVHRFWSLEYVAFTARLVIATGVYVSCRHMQAGLPFGRCCQFNANQSPKFVRQQVLGSDQLAPLEKGGVS